MDPLRDPRLLAETGQLLADLRAIHPPALQRAEQRLVAIDPQLRPGFEPDADDRTALGINPHRPELPALPDEYPHRPGMQINVGRLQLQRLADSELTTPEQADQSPIPLPSRSPLRTSLHQSQDLLFRQNLRRQTLTLVVTGSRSDGWHGITY